jgi:23S rRNA pseudouridine2605 synthase
VPVGRLDADTTGALLLTNDGRLAHRLAHPRYGVEKTYRVDVEGEPAPAALRGLAEGVELEDGRTAPAGVRVLGPSRLELVLHEGRNRQVRRMCAAVGHEVTALVRVAVGALRLADLPPGAWRRLGPADLRLLAPATRDHGRRKQRAIVRNAGPGS